MQRRTLQIVLAVLGLVPVVTGVLGLLGVSDPLYAALGLPRAALLDSNLRFYSGVWLGLGVAILATVRTLERHFALYLALWAMIFAGGVGRLLSLLAIGAPPPVFLGFIVLELVGAPLFIYWHHRVAHATTNRPRYI